MLTGTVVEGEARPEVKAAPWSSTSIDTNCRLARCGTRGSSSRVWRQRHWVYIRRTKMKPPPEIDLNSFQMFMDCKALGDPNTFLRQPPEEFGAVGRTSRIDQTRQPAKSTIYRPFAHGVALSYLHLVPLDFVVSRLD